MPKTSLVPTVLASMLLAALVVAASASAAPITIGSPLTAPFKPSSCTNSCTVVPTSFDEPGAVTTSPVDGVILRWRILDGSPSFQYRLRVISRPSTFDFTGSGISAPASPGGPGVQTFSTNLPIRAGQLIGIDLPETAPIGYLEAPGDTYAYFEPPLGEGATQGSDLLDGEVAFNAEIQPRPLISAIAPASGSFKGGTAVTIAGSDFAGVSAVTFGSVPAQSFTVVSESQIVAVAPAMLGPGAVPVSVTTVAGIASSATAFEAQACRVPQLKGKKLKRAKKRSRRALCKVGAVKKLEGATTKTGKVVKQRPKPGKVLAPGAKIRVTLAP